MPDLWPVPGALFADVAKSEAGRVSGIATSLAGLDFASLLDDPVDAGPPVRRPQPDEVAPSQADVDASASTERGGDDDAVVSEPEPEPDVSPFPAIADPVSEASNQASHRTETAVRPETAGTGVAGLASEAPDTLADAPLQSRTVRHTAIWPVPAPILSRGEFEPVQVSIPAAASPAMVRPEVAINISRIDTHSGPPGSEAPSATVLPAADRPMGMVRPAANWPTAMDPPMADRPAATTPPMADRPSATTTSTADRPALTALPATVTALPTRDRVAASVLPAAVRTAQADRSLPVSDGLAKDPAGTADPNSVLSRGDTVPRAYVVLPNAASSRSPVMPESGRLAVLTANAPPDQPGVSPQPMAPPAPVSDVKTSSQLRPPLLAMDSTRTVSARPTQGSTGQEAQVVTPGDDVSLPGPTVAGPATGVVEPVRAAQPESGRENGQPFRADGTGPVRVSVVPGMQERWVSDAAMPVSGVDQPVRPDVPPVQSASFPTYPTEIARDIVRQLMPTVTAGSEGRVDIALHPRELGHVRISLNMTDAGVTMTIAADRAETLDLMRRHASEMSATLRDLGYQNVSLSFQSGGQQKSSGEPVHVPVTEVPDDPVPTEDGAVCTTGAALADPVSGSLDLRI